MMHKRQTQAQQNRRQWREARYQRNADLRAELETALGDAFREYQRTHNADQWRADCQHARDLYAIATQRRMAR